MTSVAAGGQRAGTTAVRAVLFDLDDTLFDHRGCARAALSGVRQLHAGLQAIDPLEFERMHAGILERLHLEVIGGRLALDAARVERFRQLYRTAGVDADDALAAAAAVAYRDAYIGARVEVEGASALLAAVREQARVVVVSNNLLNEQQAKMRDCGLDRHVDDLIVSEEAGVSKPDPGIFELALERAGVRAHEAVMVGDSWANDIEGARAVGIRPIWFNRGGTPAPDPSVGVIESLRPVEVVLALILGRE
jgi:HAD superfamily hydrolase (TIGR01509 family)